MANGKRQSALLVEIMIAVLFFALSATVVLETYAAARGESSYAADCGEAMTQAQNLCARLSVADDVLAMLEEEGFVPADGGWRLPGAQIDLTVEFEEKPTAAGLLRDCLVRAEARGETLLELPCSRYIPGEVTGN